MKVDRAVFVRHMVVNDVVTSPVVSGHAADREIDRKTIQTIRRSIHYLARRDIGVEIPGANHLTTEICGTSREAACERVDLGLRQRF